MPPGVALREFPLDAGHGFADHPLYVDGKAAGIIEAKNQDATLTGVEAQPVKYAQDLRQAILARAFQPMAN
jgi:type I restriction enzyme R subunit